MKDLKSKYEKTFDKIEPTEEQRKRILNNILNRKKSNVYMRFAIVSCSLIILCLFGITNANDIRKSFNSLIINYKEKRDEDGNKYIELITSYDGVLEVDYDANLVERESWIDAFEKNLKTFYSYVDLEFILGVKFLKNDIFNFGYDINILRKDDNDKIAYMKLYEEYAKFDEEDEYVLDKKLLEYVSLTAQFKTKYYEENNDFDLRVRNYYSVKNYYINKLDTTALIVRLTEMGNHYLVIFSHNNVRYSFYYDCYETNMSEEAMLERVHEILDSFYY